MAVITCASILLAYVLAYREWFFTPLVIVIFLVASIWSLIYYIERTNQDLTHFILSIKQGGFTTTFPSRRKGKTFRKLSEAYNDVIEEFKKVSLQRETHYQYLQTLTENIQAGIISFDMNGNIQLINPAALQLLGALRMQNVNELKNIDAKLHQAINELQPGQRQLLRTLIVEDEVHLSLQMKELIMNGIPYKIVLIQDLNRELQEQEVEAWQKLIRVLTHEIMNSVTPIVSLTEAVNTMLTTSSGERKNLHQLDEEDKEDLFGSLDTIEKRSKGLLRFVNAYKDFVKTPDLVINQVDISKLVNNVVSLLGPELSKHQIELNQTEIPHRLFTGADAEWLEQVLINIIKNAMDALENRVNPMITIRAYQQNKRTHVIISDNGIGMEKDVVDKAFIPFFTTKKMGSGIGLSLSRQIMRLHKGSLNISSELNKGTIVQLEW